MTYTTAHGNAGHLNPLSEARDWTESSWLLVGFVNRWATTGTPWVCLLRLLAKEITAQVILLSGTQLSVSNPVFTHPSIHPTNIYPAGFSTSYFLGALRGGHVSVQINFFGSLEESTTLRTQKRVPIPFSMDSRSPADHSFVFIQASFSEPSAVADHNAWLWLPIILFHHDILGPWSSSEGSCWGFHPSLLPPLPEILCLMWRTDVGPFPLSLRLLILTALLQVDDFLSSGVALFKTDSSWKSIQSSGKGASCPNGRMHLLSPEWLLPWTSLPAGAEALAAQRPPRLPCMLWVVAQAWLPCPLLLSWMWLDVFPLGKKLTWKPKWK